MEQDSVQCLVSLGFTVIEAEVYTFLVKESPATGYRVAQALGRAVAGIYKTLEALAARGAVIVDNGATRFYRAVPAEELLGSLDRSFQERRTAAAQALAELSEAPADHRVYELRSLDQVYERCWSMLFRCTQLALIDCFPEPLQRLRPGIERTVARGVKVAIQTHEPVEFPGAYVNLFSAQHPLVASFPGQWIIMVVDGSEHLLAFLTADGTDVLQAIWTGSPYLSWILQCFMVSEFNFVATMNDPAVPAETREIARSHGRFFPRDIPGYQTLLSRLGTPRRDSEHGGGS